MKINDNIKALRLYHNLSLEEVAKRVGVSRQTIHRYENGIIENIPYENIEALAKVFKVSAGVLMGWEKDESLGIDALSDQTTYKENLISEIDADLGDLTPSDLELMKAIISRLKSQ